jgi:hypothetical protein
MYVLHFFDHVLCTRAIRDSGYVAMHGLHNTDGTLLHELTTPKLPSIGELSLCLINVGLSPQR